MKINRISEEVTFCAGVQKKMDNNRTDVIKLGKMTFMM